MEGLSRDDQRQIWRAFRKGTAVEDLRLGAATVAWTRSLDEACRWDNLASAVWLGWIGTVCLSAIVVQEWTTAAEMLLIFDFFALANGVGVIARRHARAMEVGTLAFLEGATGAQ